MLVSMEFAEDMIARQERASNKPKDQRESSVTVPGHGTKTKKEFAAMCGVSWNSWYQRYRKWQAGNISKKQLMEPKVSQKEAGRRSLAARGLTRQKK